MDMLLPPSSVRIASLYSRKRSTRGSISAAAFACFPVFGRNHPAPRSCRGASPGRRTAAQGRTQFVEHFSILAGPNPRSLPRSHRGVRPPAQSSRHRRQTPPRRRLGVPAPSARSRRYKGRRDRALVLADPGTRQLATRCRWSRPAASLASSDAPAMSTSRANSRTVTRMRSARLRRRAAIVGIRRRAFDPHVAAVEVLALPDGRNLLHALDHVAARRVRVAAMRRRRGDRHARLADLEPAGPVVQRNPHAGPAGAHLVGDARRTSSSRAARRLRFEVSHAPSRVVVADEAEKGHDRAGASSPGPSDSAATADTSGSSSSGSGPMARSGAVILQVYGVRRAPGQAGAPGSLGRMRLPEMVERPRPWPMAGAWRMAPATYCLGRRGGVGAAPAPRASSAATADANVQPVPCVCAGRRAGRGARERCPSNSRSTTSAPGTVATGDDDRVGAHPVKAPRPPQAGVVHRARCGRPLSASASGMFGVTTRARGSSSRAERPHAVGVEQAVAARRRQHRIDDHQRQVELSMAAATASTMAASPSMPVLVACSVDVAGDGFDLRRDGIGRRHGGVSRRRPCSGR